MSLGYQLAYRLGLTPWERAGEGGAAQLGRLFDREERERTGLGRALDLGCGTGTHTLELARRGWDAVGVDAVATAVSRARARPGADRARFLVGDVTDLGRLDLEAGIDFFLDVGCFHGLGDEEQAAEARSVTELATPAATLLLLAMRPGRRPLLPRGAAEEDLARAFTGWQVIDTEPADTSGMPAPLRRTAPRWYRLRRGGTT